MSEKFDEKAAIAHHESTLGDSRASPIDAYRWQFEQSQKLIEELEYSTGVHKRYAEHLEEEITCHEKRIEELEALLKATMELAENWMNDYDKLKEKHEPLVLSESSDGMLIEQEEITRLQAELEKQDSFAAGIRCSTQMEIDQLRAELKIAVEALDRIEEWPLENGEKVKGKPVVAMQIIAREAIAQIKGSENG